MKKGRKKYDKVFKERAVSLMKTRTNISQLSKELGVSAGCLYRWRQELADYGSGSFPGQGVEKQTEEQRRISDLEKQLQEVALERDILKKAIGIFSKSDKSSTNL